LRRSHRCPSGKSPPEQLGVSGLKTHPASLRVGSALQRQSRECSPVMVCLVRLRSMIWGGVQWETPCFGGRLSGARGDGAGSSRIRVAV